MQSNLLQANHRRANLPRLWPRRTDHRPWSSAIPDASSIRLQGVSKQFDGDGPAAVEHLDLDIDAGSIVALIGPSGCGKTTTLRMINRLVEPTAGTITIGDVDITSIEATELRRGIGYVIQQVGLFPHRTIAQNIATVPRALGWDRSRIAARVDDLVELVGLDPALLTRYPDELSGGQQQRVGVARALAADPPVLLMDEPFGAVDPIVRARLQDELLALQQQVRKTIVLVTHDIDEAVRIGDRVALLNTGGVLEQYATPDEMLAAPANEFVERFIGEDRGIKRLQLRTVGELPFHQGPVIDVTRPAEQARTLAASTHSEWVGLLDGDRFTGWVHLDELAGDPALRDLRPELPAAVLAPDNTLRTAVDVIMATNTSVAVVEDRGRFAGVVTLERIRKGLRVPAGHPQVTEETQPSEPAEPTEPTEPARPDGSTEP